MIESLEQYRAQEEELKRLLGSLASKDLVDRNSLNTEGGDAQEIASRLSAIKDDLSQYRAAHPDEFTS